MLAIVDSVAFGFDLLILTNSDWLIRTKLKTLKMVPNTIPRQISFLPSIKKNKPMIIAKTIACLPYLFLVLLIVTVSLINNLSSFWKSLWQKEFDDSKHYHHQKLQKE